ncbi:MAG: TIM barrel protein [Bdellovibrionota bacterium]
MELLFLQTGSEEMLKLSLSGRLIGVQSNVSEMSMPQFLRFAQAYGYEAVELRAIQIPAGITQTEVARFRRIADELGLNISCCTPPDITSDEAGLEQLERFTDLTQILGCDTLKVWIGDTDWLHDACELVKSHGLILITQIHTGGPFETIGSCLETLAQLGQENFGLQYDAANLFEAQQDYGEEAVKRLGTHIRQLSVQNIRLARPDEPNAWEHEGRNYCRCLLGDPNGLNYESVFRGLQAIGFDDYVTLNEPKPTLMDTKPFAKLMHDELRRLLCSS